MQTDSCAVGTIFFDISTLRPVYKKLLMDPDLSLSDQKHRIFRVSDVTQNGTTKITKIVGCPEGIVAVLSARLWSLVWLFVQASFLGVMNRLRQTKNKKELVK
jgi:hypothetical protein